MSPMDTMFLLLKRLVVIVTSFLGFEIVHYESLITISSRSQARDRSPPPGGVAVSDFGYGYIRDE